MGVTKCRLRPKNFYILARMGYYGCLPTRYKKNWVTLASNFYFRSQALKYGPIISKYGEIFWENKNWTKLYATFLSCGSGFK